MYPLGRVRLYLRVHFYPLTKIKNIFFATQHIIKKDNFEDCFETELCSIFKMQYLRIGDLRISHENSRTCALRSVTPKKFAI
jgi:hypothetical protein